MKKKNLIYVIVLFIAIYCNLNKAFSQSTSASFVPPLGQNTPFPGVLNYLGWAAGTAIPLNIKTEDNQPHNFYTNAGAGTFLNQRMIIAAGGNIGIGTNFTTPQSRLHIHAPGGGDMWSQITTGAGNGTATDGLRIGVLNASQQVNINQQEDASIDIFTNIGANNTRKMRIWHDINNLPRVAIGNINPPLTYLHYKFLFPDIPGWI